MFEIHGNAEKKMERDLRGRGTFNCPPKGFFFNILGLVFFFVDLVLDFWTVWTFYREEAYVAMGMLIFLLLASSVLLHIFSWLWYNYDSERKSLGEYVYLEKYLTNRRLLHVLHVCQLAIFFRFAGVMEISLRSRHSASKKKKGIAVYLTHDLSFLRFIETFSENVPQLTLMLTVTVHSNMDLVKGLKILASSVAIAFSVLMYHRSMRSLSVHKAQMTWIPCSLVYFLWNFLLIISRVAAVALWASALPAGMIAVHFVILWVPLFLWATLQKTDFMDDPDSEWLYRATVALIWYFSWFNVSKGNTMERSIIYHLLIAVDMTLLLGLSWWWCYAQDTVIFGLPALWVFISVGSSYTGGLIVKILYYKFCHPKSPVTVESGAPPAPACIGLEELGRDEMRSFVTPSPEPPQEPLTGARKRMQRLADHFYS